MNVLIIILLLANLGLQAYILLNKKPKKEIHKIIVEKKPKLSDEEKKKQKEMRKHFENLMDYDYDKALKKEEYKG